MKFFITLFLFIFLVACTSSEKNEIFISNKTSFKLNEGEKLVDIRPGITEDYQYHLNNSDIQIPLYKYIRNKDYRIYLGIPYNTSIEKLIKFQLSDQTVGHEELETDSLSYFFKKQDNDTTYISKFSKTFDENLIYILAITNSKIISDSLFKQKAFSNRFIQK
jgi:hypothetical protein